MRNLNTQGGKRYTTDKTYRQIITSIRWVKLRRHKLWVSPLCERCNHHGRVTPATCVHHVTPIETEAGNPDRMRRLAYDPHNLQALCEECHHEAHRELASNGKQATQARNKARTDAFSSRYLEGEALDDTTD